jgi:hypothetical protein
MSDTNESQSAPEVHDSPQDAAAPGDPTADPDVITPPVASLIASIRVAVTRGASADLRAAGASACRAILTVLEARPGQPLVALPPPQVVSTSPTSPIAALFSQPGVLSRLAAMSREELLNLVKQVTGAMPAGPQTPTTAAPRFHLIQIPVSPRRPDSK